MKDQIRKLIVEALEKLYPELSGIVFSVDYAPANIDADFASNVAMVLGKKLGKKPMELAAEMKSDLFWSPTTFPTPGEGGIVVTVAAPGFVNFKVASGYWPKELGRILKQGDKYGTSKANKGKKARVEFVSANPTGPLHVGNARGGPYGETICKVLEATGYKVLREYIHNDVGGQIQKLGKTIWYWYQKLVGIETEFPEDGYKGEYPEEIATKAIRNLGKNLTEKDLGKLVDFALNRIFEENLQTIERLGIKFDLIVKESDLQSSGKTAAAVQEIKKMGLAKENEGALWFAPNDEFLADRESVIIKSDGQPTYFASDIAYHKEKFTSGYDLVIDIFGSNHHGHAPKLRALTKVYGFDPNHFFVLLYQYVRVKRGDEVVKMAKRAGNFITAKEVLDEVGKDQMLFFLLSTAVNTHMDFDLELAKDTSDKNPVYRVQYAHARIESIKRQMTSDKLRGPNNLQLLTEPEELTLIRELSKFPELVQGIAASYEVHHLPHYLLGLADKFHTFYEKLRVISDDKKLTEARLSLVRGVQIVLANGLRLMGIEPLEKM